MNEPKNLYQSADEIWAVVRNFEACTTLPAEFTHEAHLTVALWYLSRLSVTDATERMRDHLFRFLNHYGERGYNETITVFWLKAVRNFLASTTTTSSASRSMTEMANELTATYNNSRLIFDYYSKELLASEEASDNWVEPDLRPLDF